MLDISKFKELLDLNLRKEDTVGENNDNISGVKHNEYQ